ncbi:GSCFA domain-containing protein [Winogradskyella thalassocola]|uniref:GSCFA family protein n=1 Tax=Winogradskyella thalassocola TaxID=262004 RepID=A0A1G8GUK3_9FLAO|nr:GSCFA domain-containing protein [Winogradskyella thalassocola]SDH97951.1 GSCFA family protein [Winogradskyella thalassocola]
MKLLTQIPLTPQQHNQIDYTSKVLLLGSCFSENISKKFNYFKFQSTVNPFGILFQPLAIESLITNAINEKVYTDEDVFFQNEQWHCFEAHSQLSSASKVELLDNLNVQIKCTHQHIKEASHIIITLGTSWVYRAIETDTIVANCHKAPQRQFLKELISVEAITESLQAIITLVKSVNPKVSFLFTVSPVRHIKDGFVENMQSKAHLITAIHNVIEARHQNYYFPSYEILMDELRDYRFYTEDMIHPNQTAISYIWGKFQKVWISETAFETMDEVEIIQKGLQHLPFNFASEAHQKFLQKLADKKAKLQTEFPHITF